ncbi:septum formation protein Maf [Methanolobus zinderi]|uniref:dTTP/UTP pyrophosphatase n=1 Tax=Methanolobus zinderi TaxID=536044 RepID=A0A7D5IBJ7_9EURY|nr:Maf family nucleotide pyrophosphatase [Methanolobus zinderi]QLC49869.1 septum formation protein Maf [Methanolobus zinderi]
MTKIILASASPRRKELLKQLIGDNFQVFTSSYGEERVERVTPEELVTHHSLEKARDVAGNFRDGVIIAADTVVVCGDEVLGKPENENAAREMLRRISGQQIQAITGITVFDIGRDRELTQYETTRIWISDLTEKEIDSYVGTGEPFGKAGSFAIQGKGADFVERIEGDLSNVVGLPLPVLKEMLVELDKEN